MPNHFDGIIELLDNPVGATRRVAFLRDDPPGRFLSGTTHRVAPTTTMGPASGSAGAIIGQFDKIGRYQTH